MLQKILAPLDGSQLAEQALPYAEALARQFNGQLLLLWVIQPPMLSAEYGDMTIYDAAMSRTELEAQRYLSNLQEIYRQRNIPTRTIIVTNPSAAEGIVEVATEEKADVIVKTTHGRSGLGRWLFGSVATKVLQEAPCPVFLVRIKKSKASKSSTVEDARPKAA
jgi:nucleotide-binding universal stress UspA family protein